MFGLYFIIFVIGITTDAFKFYWSKFCYVKPAILRSSISDEDVNPKGEVIPSGNIPCQDSRERSYSHCKLPFAKQYNFSGRGLPKSSQKNVTSNNMEDDIRFCAPCYAASAGRAIAAETAAAGQKAKSYALSAGYKKKTISSNPDIVK